MKLKALVFDDFETLDLFGPVELLAGIPEVDFSYHSLAGGLIRNRQGVELLTQPIDLDSPIDILLLPGGRGTRSLVENDQFLTVLKEMAERATFVLSVCTGSALLAKAGLLDGKKATSNKLAFNWVSSQGSGVFWQRQKRWVCDGNYYTSSGVSAGMDMALGFVSDQFGRVLAEKIARQAEYNWQDSPDRDDFA
ncbi:DJ-1/PfpI family protein [Streptococcus suis]|uniref:DJ-1/PfpI family protein n=1 Tax=Streptococcus suis TaxID=1307 RepID=UPI001478B4A4